MRKLVALISLISLLSSSLGATSSRLSANDISGTWSFSLDLTVHTNKGAKEGAKLVTFVLKQQGEQLTGTCCAPEEKITGLVRGNDVTFEHEFSREGKTQKITYSGVLETPTKMAGTRNIIRGNDQIQQRWSATKQDR